MAKKTETTKPERSEQEIRESALAGELKVAQNDLTTARADLDTAHKELAELRKSADAAEKARNREKEAEDRLIGCIVVAVLARDAMVGDVPTQVKKPVASFSMVKGVTVEWLVEAIGNGTVRMEPV